MPRIEYDRFSEATSILIKWTDVDFVNINKLRSLNCPVAKIRAVHEGGLEAKRAESDMAKGLEAELLLAKGAWIMLMANLWMRAGLVNGSMGTIREIIFEEDGPPYLPRAVLISFDHYQGPTITALDGTKVVPIVLI